MTASLSVMPNPLDIGSVSTRRRRAGTVTTTQALKAMQSGLRRGQRTHEVAEAAGGRRGGAAYDALGAFLEQVGLTNDAAWFRQCAERIRQVP